MERGGDAHTHTNTHTVMGEALRKVPASDMCGRRCFGVFARIPLCVCVCVCVSSCICIYDGTDTCTHICRERETEREHARARARERERERERDRSSRVAPLLRQKKRRK